MYSRRPFRNRLFSNRKRRTARRSRPRTSFRHLLAQRLEDRRVLATLGIDILFLEDNNGAPGAELQAPILRGEAFWVDVRVQDVRDTGSVGVIALPLNLSWDPALFDFTGDGNLTAAGNNNLPLSDPLVTDQFPLQRAVDSFDDTAGPFDGSADPGDLLDFFNLRGVQGGALPNASQGQAIGDGTAETFSQLRFVAIANSSAAPFTVNLDGSMSFADADQLDGVSAIGNATDVTALDNTVAATVPIAGGRVSGTKFNDVDGNGTRDPGDGGVGGVTIQLTPVNPAGTTQETITEADGSYSFDDLPAGTYTVNEVVPPGSVLTTQASIDASLAQGSSTAQDLDFGNFQTTTFSGIVFNDLDGDGERDAGEPGIGNVTVNLDLDSDGGAADDTTTTSADGSYQFTGIRPGTHAVSQVVPSGFSQTLPATTGYTIVNASGQDRTDLDFGNAEMVAAQGMVAGFVYEDRNRDGVFDDNEIGLPGVTIQLFVDTSATPLQTTTTLPDGSYLFSELSAGTYRVVEIQPAGFSDATATPGTVLPSGQPRGTADGLNAIDGITINDSESAIDYNFGDLGTVSKRRFLASTNLRSEVCNNTALACRSIEGTSGDDQIRIENLSNDRLRVTVNDAPPVEFAAGNADVVLVDGRGGNDSVTYIGNDDNERFSAAPSQLAVSTATQQVGVFNVPVITVQGGTGDDSAIIRDSTGSDTLMASGNSVTLDSPNDQRINFSAIDTVRAISAVDNDDDQATIDTIDFVLQLAGDWI